MTAPRLARMLAARLLGGEGARLSRKACRLLLGSRAGLQLLPLAGQGDVVCEQLPPLELIDASGARVRNRGGGPLAALPLVPPFPSYAGPFPGEVASAMTALADVFGAKPPMICDANVEGSGSCRPRLGCTPAATGERLAAGDRVEAAVYKPLVHVPALLSWRLWRPRSGVEVEVPWLCLGLPGLKTLWVRCRTRLCRLSLEPRRGAIALEEGEARWGFSRRCPATRLYIDYLVGLAASRLDGVEWRRPVLWLMSPTVLLGVEGRRRGSKIVLDAALWSPYPRAFVHTIVFSGYKVEAAALRTHSGWDQLIPSYDRVKVPLPPFGLGVVRLVLRRLPPLLSGAGR